MVNRLMSLSVAAMAIIGLVAVGATLLTVRDTAAPPEPSPTSRASAATDPRALKGLAKGAMGKLQIAKRKETAPKYPFLSPDGAEITLASFAGKTVLVNLWAPWCAPCVEELPSIDALAGSLPSEAFAVVAINVDRSSTRGATDFFAENGIAHLAPYADPSLGIVAALETRGLPTTVLYDRTGREMGRLLGSADWASEDAKALVTAIASAGGSE